MKKLFFVCSLWVSQTLYAQVAIDLPINQVMDPLAAFQVCGTVRIDSLPLSVTPTYVLLLDADDTLIHKMPFASFVTLISESISTTTTVPITRLYTSNTTWTKPLGLKYIVVEMVGGGGGGAGSGIARGQIGGGGGGGGYTRKTISSLSLSTTENIVIGTGGAGGAINGGSGTNGTTSSFGNHCSTTGGFGGVSIFSNAQGGIGGTGIGGDINITGNGGGGGAVIGNGIGVTGGSGGGSFFGGAAPGSGVDSDGLNGGPYGGGGSGGSFTNATRRVGGRGADGVILIIEHY